MAKKCDYCGEGKVKPLTWSQEHWDSKEVIYCSPKCLALSKRIDVQSYIGRFLVMNGITLKDFTNQARNYIDLSGQVMHSIATVGLNYNGYSEDSRIIAKRLACAIHDLVPDMLLGEGWYFDYRLILVPTDDRWWDIPKVGSGRKSQLSLALAKGAIGREDFLSYIEEQIYQHKERVKLELETFPSNNDAKHLVSVLTDSHALYEDEIPILYGDKKWRKMLKQNFKKDGYCTAKVAYDIAKLLQYFSVYVDYRMLMEEVKPHEYIRLKKNLAL